MNKMKQFNLFTVGIIVIILSLFGCNKNLQDTEILDNSKNAEGEKTETNIRIITTSDLHGKMVAWDYFLNEETKSGSLAQVGTVIKKFRDDNTIVVDVGDVTQDNSAELFLDEEVHPMIQGMNNIGYDICTLGNHEFNFGMDNVKKVIKAHKAKVLLSNVYDSNGKRLAEPYTIVEKNGVKIAFIGVDTPNILRWDAKNLRGYTVTNPVDEIKKAIKEIDDSVDAIIVLAHMDEKNELNTYGSGLTDIVNACPEIDFICGGHGHREVVGKKIDNCTYVENLFMGQTVMITDIKFAKNNNNNYQVKDVVSKSIKVSEYEEDKNLLKLMEPYDKIAKEEAKKPIGKLQGGSLVNEDDIKGITRALIEDTALMDLINEVQMYYTGADVSAAPLTRLDSNLKEGDIKKSDINNIYKYDNMLYKLKMTGWQLKKWMEWSANFYKKSSPGDLTIAFNENKTYFLCDMFSGVNYDINISKPVGERIENLTWPDGRPVKDEDVFTVTTTNYRVNSALMVPGEIYSKDEELPVILEENVRADIGNIKTLIADYIKNVKNGILTSKKIDNWKITGFKKDVEKQKEINEFVKEGKIKLTTSNNDRIKNTIPVTEKMLEEARNNK